MRAPRALAPIPGEFVRSRGRRVGRLRARCTICTVDVVWTPPGVKHWHGATAVEGMTHIAVLAHVDGKGSTG